MHVFADGGDPGNPPFCPPTVEGRPNKKLSTKNGDLHVSLIHMSNASMGLSMSEFPGASSVTACHAASYPPFILIPRCYCTMFTNLGNALCDAFDSLLWAIPTSTTRGKSKRVIRCSVDNYICIGACAARGHKGVNCVQSGLQKVHIEFQIMAQEKDRKSVVCH